MAKAQKNLKFTNKFLMAGAGLVPDRILVGLKFGTKTREVTKKGGAFWVLSSQTRVLCRRSLQKMLAASLSTSEKIGLSGRFSCVATNFICERE